MILIDPIIWVLDRDISLCDIEAIWTTYEQCMNNMGLPEHMGLSEPKF